MHAHTNSAHLHSHKHLVNLTSKLKFRQRLNCSTPRANLHSCILSLCPGLYKNTVCSTSARFHANSDTCSKTHIQTWKQPWGQVNCHIGWHYISHQPRQTHRSRFEFISLHMTGLGFGLSAARGKVAPGCAQWSVAFCTNNCCQHLAYYCFSTKESAPIRSGSRCTCALTFRPGCILDTD